jgi:hypothetical protein
VNHERLVSTLLGACFALGLACGSGDDLAAEDSSALDESSVSGLESEADLASSEVASLEQAITMPAGGSGGAAQCLAACTRVSTVDITGQCCSCSGLLKKFVRAPGTSPLYLCK